jgi:hypothetical protein
LEATKAALGPGLSDYTFDEVTSESEEFQGCLLSRLALLSVGEGVPMVLMQAIATIIR